MQEQKRRGQHKGLEESEEISKNSTAIKCQSKRFHLNHSSLTTLLSIIKLLPTFMEIFPPQEAEENIQPSRRNGSNTANPSKEQGDIFQRDPQKQLYDTTSEGSQAATAPNQRGDSAFTAPIPVSASSGFAWVKKRKEEATSTISDGLKSQISALDPSFANYTFELTKKQNGHTNIPVSSGAQDYEIRKQQRRKHDFPESFDASEAHPFLDMSNELYSKPPSNATTNLVSMPSFTYKTLQKLIFWTDN